MMKKKVLTLLKESDGYLSGQDICEKLEVSRTAIWKVMKQLREEGYQIESASNRGYRLLEVPDRLTEAELGSRLENSLFGKNIIYKEEIDSTNIEIKRQAEAGALEGTLAVAEFQRQGKGRRGRAWSSPKGSGIWMSFLLRPQLRPENASSLTLVAALAVSRAIEKVAGLSAQIKWPNDLVIGGKKICGILTEMSSEMDFIHYAVVGIGINANIKEFPEELPYATSLFIEGGREYNRAELAAVVLKEFESCYQEFLAEESLERLLSDYNSRLVNRGSQVQVIKGDESLSGIARGVNAQGGLLVETESGIETILSGEVSVRGVYGYV